MLAREHRVTHGNDYRRIVRKGQRVVAPNTVIHVVRKKHSDDLRRYGFIVTKKVGNAVNRNRVRRKLKAAAHATLSVGSPSDIVVRALPSSRTATWATLHSELVNAIEKTQSTAR